MSRARLDIIEAIRANLERHDLRLPILVVQDVAASVDKASQEGSPVVKLGRYRNHRGQELVVTGSYPDTRNARSLGGIYVAQFKTPPLAQPITYVVTSHSLAHRGYQWVED